MFLIEKIDFSFFSNKFNKILLVEKLANLHYKNLPNSQYTLLGIDAVKLFYFSILSSKRINLYLAKKDKSEIVGFIISSNNNLSIFKLILFNIFSNNYIKPRLFTKFFNFRFLMRMFLSLFYKMEKITFDRNKKYIKIISLIVSESYQGKGIGKSLIKPIFNLSRLENYDNILAVTTTYQKKAICFYDSINEFKIIKKFKIDENASRIFYIAKVS